MKALLGRAPLALVSLSCLLSARSALAGGEDALAITSPEDGEVHTVVTGQDEHASVAYPDGPALMTPLWLIAQAEIRWMCSDGPAVRLEVKADKGPQTRPLAFDLRKTKLQGSTTRAQVYTWEVASVKAACAKEGEARVESTPVHLTLTCPKGRRVVKTQRLVLQARCRPTEPSQEAVTGLTGSEMEREVSSHTSVFLSKFSHHQPYANSTRLHVGQRQTVTLGQVLRPEPEIRSLRVVRVDAERKVLERFAPSPRLDAGGDEDRFEPRVILTPKQGGPLHLALEAEYPDGSRVVSRAAEVTVETPQMEAQRRARALTPEQRAEVIQAVDKKLSTDGCGPELVPWLKQLPHVSDAGSEDHNLWLQFSDGRPYLIHCH